MRLLLLIAFSGLAAFGPIASAQPGCDFEQDAGAGPHAWVLGAVASPGAIALDEGLRVSAAVQAAGGLANHAYPLGAMLLRAGSPSPSPSPSAEQQADTDQGLGAGVGQLIALQLAMDGRPPANALAATRKKALLHAARQGHYRRLPVAVDAATSQRFPDRDMMLAAGDVLYVPARSHVVAVVGAVGAPALVAFESGADVLDYVQEAGGWARRARREAVVAYLPQGGFRELSPAFWDYQPQNVPPGSVLLVPEDTRPGWIAALAAALPAGLFRESLRLPEASGLDAVAAEGAVPAGLDEGEDCNAGLDADASAAWR